jgi:hypothetical protein
MMIGIGSTVIGGSKLGTGEYEFLGVLSPFYALFNGTQDIVILIEVDAYTKSYPFDPVPTYRWQYTTSATEWRSDSTTQGYYPMRLQNPMNFARQATGNDPFGSAPDNYSFGAINVNIDSEDEEFYEDLGQDFPNVQFVNADIKMYVGLVNFDRESFEQIFTGKVKSASWTPSKLTLNIRDPDFYLTEDIQKNKYDGLGGAGGSENLENVPKPVAYGYCQNINPVLIDASWHVYQVHDGPVEEIETLYDGGWSYGVSEFDVSADASVDTVWDWEVAHVPTGGQWITDHANGLLRLATRPAFTLTCDVKAGTIPARSYNSHVAYVVEAMMIDRLYPITGLAIGDIIGVTSLDSIVPYDTGVYVRSGGTTLDAEIQKLLGPIQCFLGYTIQGEYELRALRFGTGGSPVYEHEIHTMKRLDTVPEPADIMNYNYAKNWTVRDAEQLALNATEDFINFSKEEYRIYKTGVSGIGASKSLREHEIYSLLINHNNAQSESVRQWFMLIGSDIYEITITQRVLSFLPGDTVQVYYDGYGFQNGKLMLLLGVRENGRSGTTVLRAWGDLAYGGP